MNLVGELVLTRNKLVKEGLEESERRDGVQRLNVLTSQLQEVTMHTRMQPVSGLWRTMRHLVRQTAQRCNKQVHFVASGQDTELDKSLLEAIKDPLTHLLRNAIDHGIEPPDERTRLDKPQQGWVELRASHEGGVVNIEVDKLTRNTLHLGYRVQTDTFAVKAKVSGDYFPSREDRVGRGMSRASRSRIPNPGRGRFASRSHPEHREAEPDSSESRSPPPPR